MTGVTLRDPPQPQVEVRRHVAATTGKARVSIFIAQLGVLYVVSQIGQSLLARQVCRADMPQEAKALVHW